MKKVLVTGGAGFVGSHLCDRLIRDGHEVICLDNLFTGSQKNIQHLIEHPNFTFIKRDIQLPFFAKVDWIFNLACPASPVHYQHDPVATVRTNVLGIMTCLDLAKVTGARLLQASTSEVYGDPEQHPQNEKYWGNVNPISRRACYDEGKRCAETLCFDYHREFGVDVKIVRIFNTYGPRMAMHDGRVVSNFILQALRGEDITIYGDGSYTRSFQYIDDLIEGMMCMMQSENFTGPVNIGNPGEFSILELANMVVEMTGSSSKITHLPAVADDPKQRRADIALAKEKLDWEPTVQLHDGLFKTIDYFKQVI
ncbi:MAG: UDP-glucuronic acid decarboxylase family protein [Patescibacteria group bacterium]|nr:SDR family oxidoreductase [Patescibacteria group bacterium]MBU2509412.1 SDR family oxidoreductase [Patescibacteria group bacterium]